MDYSRFKIRTPSLGILSRSMLCRSQISKGSTEYFREFNIQPILHRHRHTDTQTQKSPSKNNALINELAPKSNPDPTMRHSPSNAPPPALHTPTYYHMQLRGARLIHSHILRMKSSVAARCTVRWAGGGAGAGSVGQGSIPPVTTRVNPIFLDPAQAMSDNPRGPFPMNGLSPAEFREEISTPQADSFEGR